ncbi:hypothetical protein ABH945_007043, partial [Paraburkholderia sp. GAS333]
AVIALNESLHESPGISVLIQFRRSTRFHTVSTKNRYSGTQDWVALSLKIYA